MPGPVWSVPDKIAWNYLIIADVYFKGSTFELYRYSNLKPTNGLPTLDKVAFSTFIGLEVVLKTGPDGGAFRSPTEDTYLEDIADHLIRFADKVVPDAQKARTPILFYGTGSSKVSKLMEDHKLMPTMCSLVKDKSPYLISDCKKQFRIVDENHEAILSWIAANRQHTSQGGESPLSAEFNSISLGNSAISTVYMDQVKEGNNVDYTVSLPLSDRKAETYILHVQTNRKLGMGEAWDKYIESGKTECLFAESKQKPGKESGDFRQCKKDVSNHLKGVPRLSGNREWKASGEISNLHSLVPTESSADTLCATSWKELDKEHYSVNDLTRLCFKTAYYRALLEESLDEGVDLSYQPNRWTEGRALLYAADELNPRNKHHVGIRQVGGSQTWQFNAEVSRPNLGSPVTADSGEGSFLRIVFPIAIISFLAYFIYINRRKYVYRFIPGRHLKKFNSDRYELGSSLGHNY